MATAKKKVFKLSPAVKAKWVTALRSGKFKQGKGALCRDPKEIGPGKEWETQSYCCLGVLGSVCGLPEKKMANKDFLLKRLAVVKVPKALQTTLADVNDEWPRACQAALFTDLGYAKAPRSTTFRSIATWIEANL